MKFSIKKEENGVVHIQLLASLEGGPDTFELKDEVKGYLGAGERKFLLDMSGATFVNSTGIGLVVGIYSSIKQAEGKFAICGVSDRARRAFVVTGVWALFQAFDSCEEAIQALAAD